MIYNVLITSAAQRQLERYVEYTAVKLNNKQAARKILEDAENTKHRLITLADSFRLCEDEILAQKGYRKIRFSKHNFFMIYRIDCAQVIVDAMYHGLQDVDSVL